MRLSRLTVVKWLDSCEVFCQEEDQNLASTLGTKSGDGLLPVQIAALLPAETATEIKVWRSPIREATQPLLDCQATITETARARRSATTNLA